VINQLDVVILIDNSGSMGGVISSAQRGSQRIVEGVRELVTDTRFAIGAFSDYVDIAYQLFTNFSTSLSAIQQGINSIPQLGGGDRDETYGRALWEIAQLDWRENAARVVIVFTDAPPKNPDPGIDERSGTQDDIQFNDVVSALIAREIRVIGVNSGGGEISQLRRAAEQTQGLYIDLSDVNTIPETIINLLQGILETYRIRFTPQNASQSTWFSQTPTSFDYPLDGASVTVALNFCPSQHRLVDGNYPVNLDLGSGSANYGTLPLTLEYYQQCLALTIPDTPDDNGTGCSADVFWESPSIVIRSAPDALYDQQSPRIGEINYVYVQVNNRGPEATSTGELSLYSSNRLIPAEFPADWSLVGRQAITLNSGETEWFGPFEWIAQTELISLRAQVEDREDGVTQPNNPRCDSNIAQINHTPFALDNHSIVPNYIGAAISIPLNLPSPLRSADVVVNADVLTPDAVILVSVNSQDEPLAGNVRDGELIGRSLVTDNENLLVTLGASAPVHNAPVYVSLRQDGEIFAGGTLRVSATGAINIAPPDVPPDETAAVMNIILIGAGLMIFVFVIVAILGIAVRRGD